jgi:hypothetical protein
VWWVVFHLAVVGRPWFFLSCGSAVLKSLPFCTQLVEEGNELEVRCVGGFHWPGPEAALLTLITETFSTQPCLLARKMRRVVPKMIHFCFSSIYIH